MSTDEVQDDLQSAMTNVSSAEETGMNLEHQIAGQQGTPALSAPSPTAESRENSTKEIVGQLSPRVTDQVDGGGRTALSQIEKDIAAKQQGRGVDGDIRPGVQFVYNTFPGNGPGLSNLEQDILAKQRGVNPNPAGPGAHLESGKGELSRLEQEARAKQRAADPDISGQQYTRTQPGGQLELSQLEKDIQAKNMARPIGTTSMPGAQTVSSPGDQSHSGQKALSQLERDLREKQISSPAGTTAMPGAHAVSYPGAQTTGQKKLSQLERDIQSKQTFYPEDAASTPGAQAVFTHAAPTFGHKELSQLERDIHSKQTSHRVGTTSTPGAQAVSASSPQTFGQSQLSQLERDIQAKTMGYMTEGTPMSRVEVSTAIDQSIGQKELSQLESDIHDVWVKHRERPIEAPSVQAVQAAGQQQLLQLEIDVQAKQLGQPHGISPRTPGAHHAYDLRQLSRQEQDAAATQNALPDVGSQSAPGAHASPSYGQLSQFEHDVAAKKSAGHPGIPLGPGAQPVGQRQLAQLEQDIAAKEQSRPDSQAAHTALPTGQRELSQLELDLVAKQAAASGVRPIGQVEVSQWERDIPSKQSAARRTASSLSVPGAYHELNQLEIDVTEKGQANGREIAQACRSDHIHSAENDAASMKNARVSGVSQPGFLAVLDGGRTQLSSLESDVIAKDRARAEINASMGLTAPVGDSQLSNLENDVLAKNRATRTMDVDISKNMSSPGAQQVSATPGLSDLERDVIAKNQVRGSGQRSFDVANGNAYFSQANSSAGAGVTCSAELELSNLERDVTAKSRIVPDSLIAGAGPSRAPSHALHVLENSINQKFLCVPAPPPEQTPLYSAIGHNNNQERSIYEVLRLGERTAYKGGVEPLSAPHQPEQLVHDYGYYDDRIGGQDDMGYEDSYPKVDSGNKNDIQPEGGIEQARDDKVHVETRPGEVDAPHPPSVDMEYGEIQQVQQAQLAIATAIEEEEGETFLPAAVQYDPDAKPPIYKNRRFRLYGFVGLCFILAVAAVAIVVTQVSGDGDNAGPTLAPTSFRESLGIKQQLEEVFGSDFFGDPESIRSKALNWLINEDPFQIAPDAENLIQRFVMVLFYIDTSQSGPWYSCNPPKDKEQDHCYFQYLLDGESNPYTYTETYWTRWLTGTHECDWAGVTCHSKKVTELSLDAHIMSSTFPTELIKLDYMRDLSLTHNNLYGSLPSELATLKHLTDVQLQSNNFKGTIPTEWYSAKNIIRLNIGGNQLLGSLPAEFGRMTDLQRVFLQSNLFSGPLPPEIYDMTNLRWLFMGNNRFSGTISTEIASLTNVEYFYFERNLLSGSIPTQLGLLTEIREIDLYDNLISGKIPEELYTGLHVWLNSLGLSNCLLTGTISTNIGLLDEIDWYTAEGNDLTGTIPTQVGKLKAIRKFHVNGNRLTGTMPTELCQLKLAQGLRSIKADCSPRSSTGEIPLVCPAGCCDECCNQDTGICLPAA